MNQRLGPCCGFVVYVLVEISFYVLVFAIWLKQSVTTDDGPSETMVRKLDASDPISLHGSDSSNLTIVYVKLKGSENYIMQS
ncbi:hypothetical protein HanIR_Chr07g0307441 [Helianthus annuus]|nr:hypothetical protein HanIR_Chr07g0307441 [Helianthus annuus]